MVLWCTVVFCGDVVVWCGDVVWCVISNCVQICSWAGGGGWTDRRTLLPPPSIRSVVSSPGRPGETLTPAQAGTRNSTGNWKEENKLFSHSRNCQHSDSQWRRQANSFSFVIFRPGDTFAGIYFLWKHDIYVCVVGQCVSAVRSFEFIYSTKSSQSVSESTD